jgi:primosomal protein N' (replication factor Y)
VVQTYWPDHPALRAVATHDPALLYDHERAERGRLGYPPFGRLANITLTGEDLEAVRGQAAALARTLTEAIAHQDGWRVLGPSPSPIARVRRLHRWHLLVKAPTDADLPAVVSAALRTTPVREGVSTAPDIDPLDLL